MNMASGDKWNTNAHNADDGGTISHIKSNHCRAQSGCLPASHNARQCRHLISRSDDGDRQHRHEMRASLRLIGDGVEAQHEILNHKQHGARQQAKKDIQNLRVLA